MFPEQGPGENGPKAPDIVSIARDAVRRWKLIAACPLALLAVALVLLHVLPATFVSSVQVLVFDPQRPRAVLSGQGPASAQDFDQTAINTEIAVLKSSGLMQRVATDLQLDRVAEYQQISRKQALLARVDAATGLQLADPTQTDEAHVSAVGVAAQILSKHVTVERVPFSYVLILSATSANPALAQRIAETILADYLADQKEGRRRSMDQLSAWLEAKLGEMKLRVAAAQREAEQLKASSGLTETGKGSVLEEQIAGLNAELVAARADVARQRAELEEASGLFANQPGDMDAIPHASVTSDLMSELVSQQSQAARALSQMRARLGPGHAHVVAMEQRLAALHQAIRTEAARNLTELQNRFDISERHERTIQASLAGLTASSAGSGAYVRIQDLQRSAEADGKLYESYLTQYRETVANQSRDVAGERVISPADLPTAPAFPKRLLFLAGALASGSFIGLGVSVMLSLRRGAVRFGAEAMRTFGLPVVGMLPFVPDQRRALAEPNQPPAIRPAFDADPLSPLNQASHALRLSLRLLRQNGQLRTVLITSSLPDEGKSTLARLLAASSAGAGNRTVLVDCDLRKSSISRLLGAPSDGLTDVLRGTKTVADVCFHDMTGGCDVIPAGRCPDSPADLLSSLRMEQLLSALRRDYDLVVLDTPPVLSAIDALALAPLADQVLVVVDASFAHEARVQEALHLLEMHRTAPASLVYNKLHPDQLRSHGYDYTYGRQPNAARRGIRPARIRTGTAS